jgi:hypothetical protein
MSLADDKKNVFNTIGAYTSMNEEPDLPETNNTLDSVNNKNDVGSFLIDVLGVTVGTTALQNLTGELFTNFAESAEPKLKAATKKQLTNYNSGDPLPESFKNGTSVSAKDIDVSGKLKTSPNSASGKLLYDNNKPNFDQKAREAITNEGTDVQYNNVLINYDSNSDSFNFKPSSGSENQNIGDFMNGFVDNTEFINKKEFTTKTLDNVFGSATSNQDKSIEELTEEEELNRLIQQIIDGDETFVIPEDEFQKILKKAQELKNGIVNYDMGCGLVQTKLPIEDFDNLISNISGSSDPNDVGNKISDALDKSFDQTNNENVGAENKETVKNGFFARIIDFIKLQLGKLLAFSPQSRMLLALSSSFQNGGIPQIGNPKKDLERFKTYIKCLIKEALSLLYEFIFNLIVAFLVKLITPIIKDIIQEKINQFINIIKSLISSKI